MSRQNTEKKKAGGLRKGGGGGERDDAKKTQKKTRIQKSSFSLGASWSIFLDDPYAGPGAGDG